MTYSGLELADLVKMGVAMASADGKFAEEEKIAIVMELAAFGVGQSDVEGLLRASQTMEASQAFGILASMTTEQKKYAMQQDDDLCAREPFVKYDVSGNLEEMTKSIPLPVLQSWYDKAMEDYKAGRCITLSQLDDMVNRLYGSVKLPESFDYKTNLEDALRERYL